MSANDSDRDNNHDDNDQLESLLERFLNSGNYLGLLFGNYSVACPSEIFCLLYDNGYYLRLPQILYLFTLDDVTEHSISYLRILKLDTVQKYKKQINKFAKDFTINVDEFNDEIYAEMRKTDHTLNNNDFYLDFFFSNGSDRVYNHEEFILIYKWLKSNNIVFDKNIINGKSKIDNLLILYTDDFEDFCADPAFMDKIMSNGHIVGELLESIRKLDLDDNTDNEHEYIDPNILSKKYILAIYQKYYYKMLSLLYSHINNFYIDIDEKNMAQIFTEEVRADIAANYDEIIADKKLRNFYKHMFGTGATRLYGNRAEHSQDIVNKNNQKYVEKYVKYDIVAEKYMKQISEEKNIPLNNFKYIVDDDESDEEILKTKKQREYMVNTMSKPDFKLKIDFGESRGKQPSFADLNENSDDDLDDTANNPTDE